MRYYRERPIRFINPYEPLEDEERNLEKEYEDYMKHLGNKADEAKDEAIEKEKE